MSIVASSEFNANYAVSKLFDATVTAADIGVTGYGTEGQYAGSGLGPHNVFMDFGAPVTTDGFVYGAAAGLGFGHKYLSAIIKNQHKFTIG